MTRSFSSRVWQVPGHMGQMSRQLQLHQWATLLICTSATHKSSTSASLEDQTTQSKGYTVSVPLTFFFLSSSGTVKFYGRSPWKTQPFLLQKSSVSIRTSSNKHRLATTKWKHKCHSPLCPGLFLTLPLVLVQAREWSSTQSYWQTGKVKIKLRGKSKAHSILQPDTFAHPHRYLHDQDTGAGRGITWQKPLRQQIHFWTFKAFVVL